MGSIAPSARPASWRYRASLVIRAIHLAVVAFFLIGWMLPWRGALWTVVVGGLLTQLNWWATGNRCVLTIAEERLRAGSAWASTGRDETFVARLVTSVIGRPCPPRLAQITAHLVLWASIGTAAFRLVA